MLEPDFDEPSSNDPDPYQNLAAAVITSALTRSTPDQRRAFLASRDLDFWCAVAGLKATEVRMLANGGGKQKPFHVTLSRKSLIPDDLKPPCGTGENV